ncbi:MAG: polysaccharide deacetylase family protein [Candidatus Obscuribacterales bacterium]|nr:polysaccharide deacetylase family protein [Candidatus Obscuribacterales bacterium]
MTANLWQRFDEYADQIAVKRLNLLTQVAKQFLPAGYWEASLNKQFGTQTKPVHLTFDDGPHPETTPYLLELLEKENIKATFFLIGKQAEKHPELVSQIDKAGHKLGNHSYSHKFLPYLSNKKIEQEIDQASHCILEATGSAPLLFRPPYGLMDKRTAARLAERNLQPIYWSSAPEDWSLPGAERVIRRVCLDLRPGSLIVLHEGKNLAEQTLLAAKEIIYMCKTRNLQLTRVEPTCLTSEHR